MQKRPDRNGHIEAAIRNAMGQPEHQSIPMITDRQGRVVGIPAVVMAVNKNVMAALEEMVRHVVREELAQVKEDGNGEDNT